MNYFYELMARNTSTLHANLTRPFCKTCKMHLARGHKPFGFITPKQKNNFFLSRAHARWWWWWFLFFFLFYFSFFSLRGVQGGFFFSLFLRKKCSWETQIFAEMAINVAEMPISAEEMPISAHLCCRNSYLCCRNADFCGRKNGIKEKNGKRKGRWPWWSSPFIL